MALRKTLLLADNKSMLVCICKGLAETDLKQLIDQGAGDLDELMSCSGAGSDCGTCQCRLQDLLETHQEHHQEQSKPPKKTA